MSGPESSLPSPLTVPMATGSSGAADGGRVSLKPHTPFHPHAPPTPARTWQRKVEVEWGMLAVDGGGGGGRLRVKLCRKGGRISERGRKMAHYTPSALQRAPLVSTHTHLSRRCDLDMVLTGPVLLKAHFTLRVFISADLCADGIAAAVPLTLQQGALYLEGAP